tara:strand:- start:364 stop:552 length:189 start_codon:yes stop_codon:yes gene_type:complete
MKNQLGHSRDLILYGSCGNVMYEYKSSGKIIVETFYDVSGEITKQNTHIKNEDKYKEHKRDS